MSLIGFILSAIFAILAIFAIGFTIARIIRNNKKWKKMEPELIRDVEESLGQEIIYKVLQNASLSGSFERGEGFWLWMAFTADYAIFVIKDAVAQNAQGYIFISRRQDASMKRMDKHYAQLKFKSKDTSEVLEMVLLVTDSQYYNLAQFIQIRQ